MQNDTLFQDAIRSLRLVDGYLLYNEVPDLILRVPAKGVINVVLKHPSPNRTIIRLIGIGGLIGEPIDFSDDFDAAVRFQDAIVKTVSWTSESVEVTQTFKD